MGVEPAFVCDGKVKSCVVTTNGTICFLFWLLFDLRHRMKASVKTAKLKKKQNKTINTVKLGIKELLNKEQIGFKELFTDYQLFYTINLLLNKELLLI